MTEHKCSVCQCDFTDDEGGVHGEFGIIPVSFCPTCFSCMCDMAQQLDGREWEDLTLAEMKEAYERHAKYQIEDMGVSGWVDFAAAMETKLKEKNYEST